jgi:hypothetical protein
MLRMIILSKGIHEIEKHNGDVYFQNTSFVGNVKLSETKQGKNIKTAH